MQEQFYRTGMLLGEAAMEKLHNSRVILFGLGGVGSYTAEALCRAGVGHLTLVDNDTVSETNRNRQLYALSSTAGRLKTEVAKERLLDIWPQCDVQIISDFYLPENADSFFIQSYDYIADAIDTVSAKLDLAVRAWHSGTPILSCMGTGNKLDPSRLRISDIYKTSVCPLCKVMRYELRQRGVPKLNVVWSDEPPRKPQSVGEATERRGLPGSVPFVPPVAGMLMAGKIILDLAGENA
ncbi:MAG: tRNA threonylcarbamoyladenosine dehydratase [Oscillospiraceae bacterium]|nr:tRNA threonylcarbamoyladenosine dehydratase [Oscillospiraceae bacterium]